MRSTTSCRPDANGAGRARPRSLPAAFPGARRRQDGDARRARRLRRPVRRRRRRGLQRRAARGRGDQCRRRRRGLPVRGRAVRHQGNDAGQRAERGGAAEGDGEPRRHRHAVRQSQRFRDGLCGGDRRALHGGRQLQPVSLDHRPQPGQVQERLEPGAVLRRLPDRVPAGAGRTDQVRQVRAEGAHARDHRLRQPLFDADLQRPEEGDDGEGLDGDLRRRRAAGRDQRLARHPVEDPRQPAGGDHQHRGGRRRTRRPS